VPVRVRAGVIGGSSGAHPPSLELVFHQAICGPVGYAAYALPGSEPLARNIASVLSQGHDIAIMENHAVVCLGTDLSAACRRLESLELCARVIIEASGLGAVHHLGEEQLALAGVREPSLPELPLDGGGERSKAAESVARQEVCRFIDRGCRQRLFSSNEGTISRRLDERSFLITPVGYDRYGGVINITAKARQEITDTYVKD
jgi:L-fuculose-phosphate aldolase